MKDDKKSAKVVKGIDVHVEQKRVDMLTQRNVLLKKLNLLKRKSELANASGKLIMNIDKPIANEVDKMDMILDKEESTCPKNSPMAKQNLLPQKMNDEQMEKGSGKLQEFMMNSKIEVKLGKLLEICPQVREMMTKLLLKMGKA
jgi:hypothetical protein